MDDIYIFFSSPPLFFLEFMNIDDLPLNLINESATRRGSLGVNRAENRKLLRWYRFVDSMGVDFVHFRECIYPFFPFLSSTIMFKLSKLGGIETFLPQNWSFLVLMLNSFQRISETCSRYLLKIYDISNVCAATMFIDSFRPTNERRENGWVVSVKNRNIGLALVRDEFP